MDNELLVRSLASARMKDTIVGPNRDEYHHILSIDALNADDDYHTTGIMHASSTEFNLKKNKVVTPNRGRGLSGIVITFWSEEHYTWSRQFLFHKGLIYESDSVLDENITYKDAVKPKLTEDKQLKLFKD